MNYFLRLTFVCLLMCPILLCAQSKPKKKLSLQEAQRLAYLKAQKARGTVPADYPIDTPTDKKTTSTKVVTKSSITKSSSNSNSSVGASVKSTPTKVITTSPVVR